MLKLLANISVGHWLWAIGISCLVGYHFLKIEETRIDTRKADETEFTAKIDAANTAAKAQDDANQARITELVQSSQPELKASFDRINAQMDQLKALAKQPAKVFKSDCTMPADAVAAYNSIK